MGVTSGRTSHGRPTRKRACVFPIAVSLVLILGTPGVGGDAFGGATEKKAHRPKGNGATVGTSLPEQERVGSLAVQYCESVREIAAEARFAHMSAHLDVLTKELEERIAKLDAQSVLLKDWMAKRDAFAQKATQQLVSIFGSMRPEAASEQLVRLDPVTAASILLRLESRVASTILNDMPPDKAAKLAGIISDAARKGEQAVKP